MLRFRRGSPKDASSGQILVIFAGALVALMALCAVVIDIAWYWSMNLRIQRAADAAALAGVVFLPNNPGQADLAAKAEAAKNGFTDLQGGVSITTFPDAANDRRLKVIIDAPVGTFFSRVVGINAFPARREAKADYVQPVPMGSPDNYYGIGYWVKPESTTTTTVTNDEDDSGWQHSAQATGDWGSSGAGSNVNTAIQTDNGIFAQEGTNLEQEVISEFDFATSGGLPNPAANQVLTIKGIEVRLTDPHVTASCGSSRIGAELSWVGSGNQWTTRLETPALGTNAASGKVTLGDAASTAVWGSHVWHQPDFGNAAFRVRLTALKGCTAPATQLRIDELEVRVHWSIETTTTTTTTVLVQDAQVPSPPGQPPITRPQGFWGAMQSQGAPAVQGDAYQAKFETRKPGGGGATLNGMNPTVDPDARYDPQRFYNYAIEIPGGTGTVWIFDPGFCDASGDGGTGERWNVSGATDPNPTGNVTRQPVSSFFDLYDTRTTLLDTDDDLFITGTGSKFRRQAFQDYAVLHELDRQGDGNPNDDMNYSQPDCTNTQTAHNGWYQLATGLPAGIYRLHSYSTDPSAPNDQDDSTGVNAFAFYAASTSGTPRIYGLGTMEAYVRLPGGARTSFYLARIDAVHAGKKMIINLWDPGDTNALNATLRILKPTGSGFARATFDWSATAGTSNPSSANCTGLGGQGADSIVTNTGGSSRFNGCWITIELQLPDDYSAPVDPDTGERGWWKIEYEMGGEAGQFSTDLTTWQVLMRGNPVHLVLP